MTSPLDTPATHSIKTVADTYLQMYDDNGDLIIAEPAEKTNPNGGEIEERLTGAKKDAREKSRTPITKYSPKRMDNRDSAPVKSGSQPWHYSKGHLRSSRPKEGASKAERREFARGQTKDYHDPLVRKNIDRKIAGIKEDFLLYKALRKSRREIDHD